MTKYLTQKELMNVVGDIETTNFSPLSTDSYNETAIADKFKSLGSPKELLYCAINFAIVGYGNKKYGNFKFKDQIMAISEIMKKFGVKMDNPKGALLSENDLTPQRLCRFFRYHIKSYIEQTKYQSYLFRKYSEKNSKYLSITFRGAEYIDELTPEESAYLLQSTRNLDTALGTSISDRLIRVFEAKKSGRIF